MKEASKHKGLLWLLGAEQLLPKIDTLQSERITVAVKQ